MSQHAALLTALVLCLCSASAMSEDQDDIKRLRDTGEILPLQVIVRKIPERKVHLLEVELAIENGRYVYDLKILGGDSTVREFRYDARTGELLGIEEEH